jgi:hypothetical protein
MSSFPDISNLITFWNKQIRPKISQFFKNPNLLEIIDELDMQIETYENIQNTTKPKQLPKKNLFSHQPAQLPQQQPQSQPNTNITDNPIITDTNSLTSPLFNLEPEQDGVNIIYLTIPKSKNKSTKYISINLLITKIALDEYLFDTDEKKVNFIEGLSTQFSQFISSEILINKIISGFNYYYNQSRSNTNIKIFPLNLIHFISTIIRIQHKFTLNNFNQHNIKKLIEFYQSLLTLYEIKHKLEPIIKSTLTTLNIMKDTVIEPIKEIQPKKYNITIKAENFDIEDYDIQSFALELTRLSNYYFQQIEYKEFFNARFVKKNKTTESPNIVALIERFNNLSFFIIEEILAYDYEKDRAKLITKFIQIAYELKKINNFNDCMSIIVALTHYITSKLKLTWKYVDKETMSMLNELKTFVSIEDTYKNIREQESYCIQHMIPFIPFLGFYTKRICYLEETGPYVKDNYLIHSDKIAEFYGSLKPLFFLNRVSFKIAKQNEMDILQCLNPLSENELFDKAKKIEPEFILNNKKTEEKRITNTDMNYIRIMNGFNNTITLI